MESDHVYQTVADGEECDFKAGHPLTTWSRVAALIIVGLLHHTSEDFSFIDCQNDGSTLEVTGNGIRAIDAIRQRLL